MKGKEKFYRTFKKVIGVFLIILGFIGLFLPIFQGILLIFFGLTFLENERVLKYFNKFWKKG